MSIDIRKTAGFSLKNFSRLFPKGTVSFHPAPFRGAPVCEARPLPQKSGAQKKTSEEVSFF